MVLEDVGEAAYRLDRLINQLRWSGAFDGVLGIALGDFVSCNVPRGDSFSLDEVFAEALEPLGVPVVTALPIGHGRTNLAWQYGREGRLSDQALWFEPAASQLPRT
jgi:muramoyltetrapeptide carboxypeptidase